MEPTTIHCECECGSREFEVRLKREEYVGLITCQNGHHSLLLDSREYWADVLQDGRPRASRCRCGGTRFLIDLEYEFRESGDVRTVVVGPNCSACKRSQKPLWIDIKYSPTTELISRPLDRIELPWLQPKRKQITSLWQPSDAERFASHLVDALNARVFVATGSYQFEESILREVEFYPELKRNLLFTNIPDISPPPKRDPEKIAPFLRLSSPFHMHYAFTSFDDLAGSVCLLHYISFAEETMQGADLRSQPASFVRFAREASEWLRTNHVSLRGRNTADNLQEHLRADKLRFPEKYPGND